LRQREEELRLHKEKLDAALDNMLQGLAMFDAGQRLIVCNRRYAEMYGLTPEQVRPGTTVRQIFEYRLANGSYHVKDSESFVDSWISNFGDASAHSGAADGRIISVVPRQMPNGALNYSSNISTSGSKKRNCGRRTFSSTWRGTTCRRACACSTPTNVVIANHRYADMYGISPDLLQEGTSLQQILEARARAGSLRQRCGQAVGERWPPQCSQGGGRCHPAIGWPPRLRGSAPGDGRRPGEYA
jgi:PAS fold